MQIETVMIEEAAEVIEPRVLGIIPTSAKHLIMIGDHQQLEARSSVY